MQLNIRTLRIEMKKHYINKKIRRSREKTIELLLSNGFVNGWKDVAIDWYVSFENNDNLFNFKQL